jgi:hypothetical protein
VITVFNDEEIQVNQFSNSTPSIQPDVQSNTVAVYSVGYEKVVKLDTALTEEMTQTHQFGKIEQPAYLDTHMAYAVEEHITVSDLGTCHYFH